MARLPELLGLADIAERFEVAKNSAWRWSRRPDFPPPATLVSGRIPVWRATEVERWARKHLPLPPGRPPTR